MFIRSLALTALCAACASAPARTTRPAPESTEEKDFAFLTDLTQTRFWSLGLPVRAQVTPDGSTALFLRALPRKAELRLFAVDAATGEVRELVTPEQVLQGQEEKLSREERAQRERTRTTARGFTSYELSYDGKKVLVQLSGKAFLVPLHGGGAQQVAGPGAKGESVFDAKLSPDGRSVAFVRGGELWVADVGGGERQITHGATPLKTHAQAEFIAQEELGRFTGYWWSPDSQKLCYEEADLSGIEQLYFGDSAHPEAKVEPTPYPRPGKANAKLAFGVVSAAGGPTTWIDWDKATYEYVARVDWQEGAPLTMLLLTRDQKDASLVAVNPQTGKVRELLHEHDDAWLHVPRDYQWLRDGSGFLLGTDRRGAPQLELHSADGALVRTLTAVDFGFAGLVHVDEKRRAAIVLRSPDPQDRQLYAVPLDGGPASALTTGPDLHDGSFARDAQAWIRIASARDGTQTSDLIRADGSVAGRLPAINERYPFRPRVEIAKVGPAPGFFTSIVRPRDFDAGRKYPVIVQVYGGPNAPGVVPFNRGYLVDQWIADHGYLVVRADNRGTSGRGHDWERAIGGRFAEVPLEDQVAALRALAEREPALDLSRVGIYGHSFGGFMSALAVLRRPDVFRAAVASAPVVEWLNYDTAYTERYLGVLPPAGTSQVYRANGLLTYARDLRRPLLILHGTADDNVHFTESLLLADALHRAGKKFEFLPLPGTTHIIADPALQVRDWQRIFGFFKENL